METSDWMLYMMMQGSSAVIPMVTGSAVAQMKENMEALSFTLNDKQLELLNQDITRTNKHS